ncbi:MAG: non-canonical purine NTP pyrophosphatase [Oligoflexales bacterium]
MDFYLNTSNKGKLAEFEKLFALHGLSLKSGTLDLPEIDADPMSVIVHKASSLDENCLVDDTSLDVEGTKIGVNIRWLLNNLQLHLGKRATWTVLLGHKKDQKVNIYKGEVHGLIVKPQGDEGFGFDPYFCPKGRSETLAQSKPHDVNARAIAVENFVTKRIYQVHKPITDWRGSWQQT